MAFSVTLKLYARKDWGASAWTVYSGALTFSVSAGVTLIAAATGYDGQRMVAPTDTAGTFSEVAGTVSYANYVTSGFWMQAAASAGSHTITPQVIAAGSNGDGELWVFEVSGAAPTPSIRAYNTSHTASGVNTYSVSSANGTPQVGDLALALYCFENNAANSSDIDTALGAPAGWIEDGLYNGRYYNLPAVVCHQIVSQAGTLSPSWSSMDSNIVDHYASILVLQPDSRTGTFSSTLGAATTSAAGTVSTAGALTKTLGAATLSASVGNLTHAASAITLGAATASSTAAAAISAAATNTLAGIGISAAGTVATASSSTGTLAVTLGGATVSSAGTAPISAASATALQAVAVASAGAVRVGATGGGTLAAVTLSAVASAPAVASVATTLGALSAASAATVGDGAALASTLANMTSGSAGTVRTVGVAAVTLQAATLATDGTVTQPAGARAGSASITLAGMTASGAASAVVTAAGAAALGGLTLVAAGGVLTHAGAAITARNDTLAATGGPVATGSASAAIGGMTVSASGTVSEPGAAQLAVTLQAMTVAASASVYTFAPRTGLTMRISREDRVVRVESEQRTYRVA